MRKMSEWLNPQNLLAAIAVLVSVVSLVISIRSYSVTKNSFEVGQRAWVSVKAGRFIQPPQAGVIPKAEIEVQNTGLSPAANVEIRISMFRSVDMSDRLPKPTLNKRPSRMTLAPNTPDIVAEISGSSPVTDEEMLLLRQGREQIHVYGYLTYDDIFGNQRRTDFCLMWLPDNSLAFCPSGNEAR